MSDPAAPHILDVTVRDGSYQIYHNMTTALVREIAKGLSEAGIAYAEVSHGMGIGSKLQGAPAKADDEELMEAAKSAAPALKLSALIPAGDFSASLLPALIEYLDIGRIGVNVDQPAAAEKVLKKLKKYDKLASVQLMRTHRRPPETVAAAAKLLEEMGVDIVYVVDTFGSFMPSEVKDYVAAIRAESKVAVGFHGHNHLGMAIPNSMAAWESGASWLDASLWGVGRDAGNTNLEALVTLLQARGQRRDLSVQKLAAAALQAVRPVFEQAPVPRYTDLLFSEFKLDHSTKEYLILLANGTHTPLRRFFQLLSEEVGDGVQATNDHVKATVERLGHNFDELVGTFEENAKNDSTPGS